jgi:hypothetical protein
MSHMPLEVVQAMSGSGKASVIAHYWDTWNTQRQPAIERWKEVRQYVYATDTGGTSNSTNGHKNSTTRPKLTQINDNLTANYIARMFSSDDWFRWKGGSEVDASDLKVAAIEGYLRAKTDRPEFYRTIEDIVVDYVQCGNCFATVEWENRVVQDESGNPIVDYVGPRVRRISPYDIVFNITAPTFEEAPKIIRSIKTLGQLKAIADSNPDMVALADALKSRTAFTAHGIQYGTEEWAKAENIQIEGFGNYQEYLTSGYVEILQYYGDYFDPATGILETNRVITVIDRAYVAIDEPVNVWTGAPHIFHTGWRSRSDNLWAMGPLENLVGMQYRIDHLENLKADAEDLAIHPPLKIIGPVEEFTWGPKAEIFMDEGGDVQEMGQGVQWVIQSENDIGTLERKMEEYAGAPSEAMGIRSPGEKTKYEVQTLDNKASRIFEAKVSRFERDCLERVLRAFLEVSRRNLDVNDVIRVMDSSIGVETFMKVTKEDLTASGRLKPIGSRHYAEDANFLQNLTTFMQSPLGQQLSPHISLKNLSKAVDSVLNTREHEIFVPFIGIDEAKQVQQLMNMAQDDMETQESAIGELESL